MLKIVLVDDENVVLQGVAHLLNETREDYVVLGSFQDPKKAETFIRSHAEQIDVVMTDIKMPDMSGVELVQRIRRIRPEIVVIAMSAYTDYEYVRQAMKNGAADYLLKPCRRQEMLDLFYRVEKEKEKREKQKVYEEKTYFLRRYLYGKLNEEKEFYRIWEMGRSIRITVLRSTSGEEKELPEDMRRENPDGIWISRREILWNFQPEERELLAKPENERFYSASLAAPWILDSIEAAIEKLEFRIRYLVFNDIRTDMAEEVWEASGKRETEKMLEEILPFDRMEMALLKGREDQYQLIMGEIRHNLNGLKEGWNPEETKRYLVRFCHLLEERLQTESRDQTWTNHHDRDQILLELRKSVTLEQAVDNLGAWLLEVLSYYQERARIPAYIRKAAAFMEANYMQELSLQTVADHVALNPWYFSSQFKKYKGVSMGEYLNQVRIQAAVGLMQESDLKLGEIAELVGFHDSAYFSSVFKKLKKMTPKEYRMKLSGDRK